MAAVTLLVAPWHPAPGAADGSCGLGGRARLAARWRPATRPVYHRLTPYAHEREWDVPVDDPRVLPDFQPNVVETFPAPCTAYPAGLPVVKLPRRWCSGGGAATGCWSTGGRGRQPHWIIATDPAARPARRPRCDPSSHRFLMAHDRPNSAGLNCVGHSSDRAHPTPAWSPATAPAITMSGASA
jgi:hypothetical protein